VLRIVVKNKWGCYYEKDRNSGFILRRLNVVDNQLILENTLDTAGEVKGVSTMDKTVVTEPITWRDFVQLAKPGIIFSNLITAWRLLSQLDGTSIGHY
jgi:hypothetical protein